MLLSLIIIVQSEHQNQRKSIHTVAGYVQAEPSEQASCVVCWISEIRSSACRRCLVVHTCCVCVLCVYCVYTLYMVYSCLICVYCVLTCDGFKPAACVLCVSWVFMTTVCILQVQCIHFCCVCTVSILCVHAYCVSTVCIWLLRPTQRLPWCSQFTHNHAKGEYVQGPAYLSVLKEGWNVILLAEKCNDLIFNRTETKLFAWVPTRNIHYCVPSHKHLG